jgi:LAO/AO transport system kinase
VCPGAVPTDPLALVAAVVAGDRRALARLITVVEEQRDGAARALAAAFEASSGAHRVGVTGAPGAGKSTLTDALITEARSRDETVGILAVDPTSPFTGGAVLGDRVRMQDHVLDDGVFIRSMANRGHLGGLSEAAPKALVALEAAGFDWIIVETVGVGQDEVEITSAADTVLVVLTPGWGDGVQAAKAGILEIGDAFVVNKADRPGVADTISDLRSMLALSPDLSWQPPIVETVASRARGVTEVWDAIVTHRDHLGADGLARGRAVRRRAELETALAAELRRRARSALDDDSVSALVAAVERGDADPWTAAIRIADA